MSTNHTPGPWSVRKSNTGSDFLHVESEAVERIAVVRFAQDAAAIAAIPEMLEILETTAGNIRSLIASCKCSTYDVWLETVEAAIAKARGEA